MAEEIKTEAKPKVERFEVESHTVFEICGSTITFRQHQVLTNPREIALAREHNVPLRVLTPIR